MTITQPFSFQQYFWKLPAQFTGNKLGSYGGRLRFRLQQQPPVSTDMSQYGPLVEIKVS